MKTITRSFAQEYREAVGRDPETMMIDPFRQMVCVEYVEWLEKKLEKARRKA